MTIQNAKLKEIEALRCFENVGSEASRKLKMLKARLPAKSLKFKIISIFLIFNFAFCINSFSQDWQDVRGDHFIIYYTLEQKKFAKDVLSHAENYYRSIAKDLGYQRYSDFWLWDKRVKIYIYDTHETYLKNSNMPEWSHGMADYNNKLIRSYLRGQGFLESILPHEIAHLLFRDFVGFTSEIPLWLDEGVAQWAEKGKRRHFKQLMKQAIINKRVLSLNDMMSLNLSVIGGDDQVHIKYHSYKDEPIIFILSGKKLINLYYLESVSLVGFLIEKYGAKKFTVFCRELKIGKSVEGALREAYSHSLRSLVDLEKKWWEYSLR